MASIDHVIVKVNDLDASIAFYVDVMGFELVGRDGPFTVIRVARDFVLQLAPYGTPGHEHYAYAMDAPEFDATFARVRERGIPYGSAFAKVGGNAARGGGPAAGADAA